MVRIFGYRIITIRPITGSCPKNVEQAVTMPVVIVRISGSQMIRLLNYYYLSGNRFLSGKCWAGRKMPEVIRAGPDIIAGQIFWLRKITVHLQ